MARHNPGDYPSANVRTAPTPSEPNTPIAEPGVNYIPNSGVVPPPTLPEEEGEPQVDPQAQPTLTNHQDNHIPTTNENSVQEDQVEDKVEEPVSKVIHNSKPSSDESNEVLTNKEPPEAVLEPRPPQQQKEQTLEDKMSKLNTNNGPKPDEDDRPLPPEDDSVPDMPDDVEADSEVAAAVVDLDEDEDEQAIGNDDL